MNRFERIASNLFVGHFIMAIPQFLHIQKEMDEGSKNRKVQEKNKIRYMSGVGVWLGKITGQDSKARKILEKLVAEIPGRNSGAVFTQRKNQWVKAAKQEKEILEFTEYIGGPDRMYSSALYIVRDVVLGQILLKEGKEKAERMATAWFIEKSVGDKAKEFEEGGYVEDFSKFLPPNVSFELGPTREVLSIVETFGREKKNWTTMAKKLAFIAERFNEMVKSVKKDMSSGDEVTRLCALMTAITIETGLRPGAVGNMATVKDPETGEDIEIDTFGVTTMQPRHVKFIRDNFAELQFIGKKGTEQIATLSDMEILKALKEAVESTSLNGDTGMLFMTKGGEYVDYNAMNRYVENKWGDITPTDFRKLKATREFYENLKKKVQEMYASVKDIVGQSKEKMKQAIVEKILVILEDAAKEAQRALSHEDWATTIKSYIDPRVIVNFLNRGGLDDTLEDILVSNKNVKLVFDFNAFIEKARRAA